MIRIDADALRPIIAEIFRRAGSNEPEAATVARRLVDSNLAGHDSHGVVRIPTYLEMVRGGGIALNQHAKIVIDTAVLVVVDGQAGFGQVIGEEAMAIGIEKAKRSGVGVVALRHSSHLGRIGDWTEQCAEAGFVSIHFVNVVGAGAIVAPFGGTDARISTNPFSAGLPRPDGRHIILDMATSKLAEGKVKVALNKGVELPEGALIDNKGRPTRNPADLYTTPRGALTPMGEHKGYGIGVFCEFLAGILSGGGTNRHERRDDKVLNNMLSIILNPAPCGDKSYVHQEANAFIKWLCASPPAEPGKPVMLPGDPERLSRAERLRDGIPLDDTTWANIVTAGKSLGMDAVAMQAKVRAERTN
jgi:uncharacterized oxidoreductase